MTDFVFSDHQETPMDLQEKKIRSLFMQMDPEDMEDRDLDQDLLMDAFRLLRQRQAEQKDNFPNHPLDNNGIEIIEITQSPKIELLDDDKDDGNITGLGDFKDVDNAYCKDIMNKHEDMEQAQKKTLQQLQSYIKNGNYILESNSLSYGYMWTQNREKVLLNILVPSNVRSKDINVTLEKGIITVYYQKEKQTLFQQKLAYVITNPNYVDAQNREEGSARELHVGEGIVDRLASFNRNSSSGGMLKPENLSFDISNSWSLHNTPNLETISSSIILESEDDELKVPIDYFESMKNQTHRLLQFEFYKLTPAGLTFWWDKFFENEPIIDVALIKDRRVGATIDMPLKPTLKVKSSDEVLSSGSCLEQDGNQQLATSDDQRASGMY